jgi:ATP-dependent DNA helicase RecQ
MVKPQQILQQYWGHASFRGEQEKIIQSVLDGHDTLALLPTGGGKSICFQIPAMLKDGLCLVVSPLIALIKDQVENLSKKNIPATALYSGLTNFEVKNTLQKAVSGQYKFLYVSPERLETAIFQDFLADLNITLIAVDEAHCISQWGYDFRPPYLRIAQLRAVLNEVPIIALTASATPLVQTDIIEKLKLKQPSVFRQSYEKLHVSYSVFKVDSKINKILTILKNVPGSSIVYCSSRKETKQVAQLLQLENINANFYHAGLTQDERNTKQNDWLQNKIRVMVCTNAFGMGIDKPDVKTVIHYNIPDCLENYYQEAGRAGRDGNKAYAVLLFQHKDEQQLLNLPNEKFPPLDVIKQVYQAIADYLQIPVGIGQGNYYDFDIIEFSKNFNIDVHLIINVLKILEKEGHLSFTESIFLPSQIQFSVDKTIINDLENTYPNLDLVMKTLLRTYEGIYENKVSVNEKLIAKIAHLPYEKVYADLNALQHYGIIEYLPQKETPQVYFIYNRAPARHLAFNTTDYSERKKLYHERILIMHGYLTLQHQCRSQYISVYFGDESIQACGSCDNCLKLKGNILDETEFKKIESILLNLIANNTFTVKELLHASKGFKQDKFWKVFQFLQAERKVIINKLGSVELG